LQYKEIRCFQLITKKQRLDKNNNSIGKNGATVLRKGKTFLIKVMRQGFMGKEAYEVDIK